MSTHSAIPAATAMQTAFLERDFSVAADWLVDDVVFNSPVLERPWATKEVVARLGPAMVALFEDVEFAPMVTDGSRAFLSFTARIGSVAVEAVEAVDVGDDERITALTVFVRPLPALLAVARAMEASIDPAMLARHLA
jgi:hypothetical protein